MPISGEEKKKRSSNYEKSLALLEMLLDYAVTLNQEERTSLLNTVLFWPVKLRFALAAQSKTNWASRREFFLQPCPRCKEDPFWTQSEDRQFFGVKCPNCPMTEIPPKYSPEEAAARWNDLDPKDF